MEYSGTRLIRAYVSRLLKKHTDNLKNQLTGVKFDDDIEFVHQTRVSTRRIRNLLSAFNTQIGRKNTKNWTPAVRSLTKALTRVRDLDVQISFLEENFPSSKLESKNRQGINRIILRKSQRREKLQPQILNAIDDFKQTGVLNEIQDFVKEYYLPNDEFFPPEELYQIAIASIDEQIKNTFTYVPFITDPTNVEDLHDMRIAIKNLRYTTEVFSDIYPEIQSYIDTFKSFQDYLGDIHDLDVWVEDLDDFCEKEKFKIMQFYGKPTPFNLLKPGINHLTTKITATRKDLYTEFIALWNKNYQELFWPNFRDQVKNFRIPAQVLDEIIIDVPIEDDTVPDTDLTNINKQDSIEIEESNGKTI